MAAIDILEELGGSELLCALAEEASELSQAALKFRRAINGNNPTVKTLDECAANMLEEISDCELILELLGYSEPSMVERREAIKKQKEARWKQRIADSRK